MGEVSVALKRNGGQVVTPNPIPKLALGQGFSSSAYLDDPRKG